MKSSKKTLKKQDNTGRSLIVAWAFLSFVIILLSLNLNSADYVAGVSSVSSPNDPTNNGAINTVPIENASIPFQMKIYREEIVYESSEKYADGPLVSVISETNPIKVVAFDGWQSMHRFEGPMLSQLSETHSSVLAPGPLGNFDDCTSQLTSVYKYNSKHWIGFYHAEGRIYSNQNCSLENVQYSIGFAETYDAGVTWIKPNYPNNKVLSKTPDQGIGIGSPNVHKIGGKFYMFYYNYALWKSEIARADMDANGKPINWKKFYNGTYSQNALGGKATTINLLNTSLSYNHYLQSFISIFPSGRWGFYFQHVKFDPTDPLTLTRWNTLPGEMISKISHPHDAQVDAWSPINNVKPTYGYPSIVSIYGNSAQTSKEFCLYYMKLFENDPLSKRSLIRRKIVLNDNPIDNVPFKIELVEYQKTQDNRLKTLVSIDRPRRSTEYLYKNSLGFINGSSGISNYTTLQNCYIDIWKEYMLSVDNVSAHNWEYCRVPGEQFIRSIGSISKIATPTATQPLYRCFDERNLDHFISKNRQCDGRGVMNWPIGYAFE